MESKIEEAMRKSFMQHSQMMMSSQVGSTERHDGIKCSCCGIEPIIGPRFMCAQNQSFNLCAKCEETTDYPHALLKVKKR